MAADINHVVLVGRLVRDSELKYISTGTAVTSFSIAVNRRVKKENEWEDEASFFDITLWGKQAESLSPLLTKGKQICVDGELRQNRWQQDGQSRSKVEVVASSIQLLSGGSNSSGSSNYNRGTNDSHQTNAVAPEPAFTPQPAADSIPDDFDDVIPF